MDVSPVPTAERIEAVRNRIAAACERAGRDPSSVLLVAVSKGQSIEAVRAAVSAGVPTLGENRVQELLPKAAAAEAAGLAVQWHFIGHLQRNKVKVALPHLSALHSVDSPRLVEAIGKAAVGPPDAEGRLPCYLEVNVAGEAQKEGIAPHELPALLAAAEACPALRVEGLMTVAPHVTDPEQVRPAFRALRELARAQGLEGLSMGMTDDFEVAIEEGATVVRVGRAIFGERPQ